MARVALLIGTGDYTEGLKALPAAPKDVDAIATVLRDPEMGEFDQVQTLINQPHATIAETIETWFGTRQKDDLALLYLSGHGVKDDRSDLYFAACNTRKRKEELVRSTAVSASFVRDRIRDSKAKCQIIILDCCFSGAQPKTCLFYWEAEASQLGFPSQSLGTSDLMLAPNIRGLTSDCYNPNHATAALRNPQFLPDLATANTLRPLPLKTALDAPPPKKRLHSTAPVSQSRRLANRRIRNHRTDLQLN